MKEVSSMQRRGENCPVTKHWSRLCREQRLWRMAIVKANTLRVGRSLLVVLLVIQLFLHIRSEGPARVSKERTYSSQLVVDDGCLTAVRLATCIMAVSLC
jgi:hypothetical protein